MEIERKFLIKRLPSNLNSYTFIEMEQGYLTTDPVIRIRRENDKYILTYKGKGLISREEYNLPLNENSYNSLKPKVEGRMIMKTRYIIPVENTSLNIELDIFKGHKKGLVMAEIEFSTLEEAELFIPLDWFGEEVTNNLDYYNSNMI